VSASPPEPAAPDVTQHAVSVLLVDDQPIIGEAVRRMLAPEKDIRFRYCQDPTRAVEAAIEAKATVILSDLVMPQLDGLELVQRFRTTPGTRRIPLIVLSTREEPATKAEAFARGANDYLVKLPDPIELIARIRHHSTGYINLLQRDEAFEALAQSRKLLADDIEQAARYVQSLLPEPTDGPVRVAWRFIPSASLGGDAFGYHWLDDDHLAIYLLDVSGHGVGSALLSVSVLNVLRSRSLPRADFRDPGAVVSGLNEVFSPQEHDGKFFTIWYGVWEASTRTLRWSGAAHPAALLFADPAAVGEPARLDSVGPMPGVLPGMRYATRQVGVAPGGRLLIYSDGVYEVRRPDGRVGTYEQFLERLADPAARDAERITRAARSLHVGPDFEDDVSLLQVDFA
jgi:sigma-B regulation protein RsbU (phosphoserine phosphatase)